jgi:DNA-binding HxlR family transcriptional regulator
MGAARHKGPQRFSCPFQASMAMIGGKWKILILYHLLRGTKRFGELRRLIPGVTQKMLTQQLRELEDDAIVSRKVYPQVPPKVEYSLTPLGTDLKPVFAQLFIWGRRQMSSTSGKSEKAACRRI